MPYNDPGYITIEKELRDRVNNIRVAYDLTWAEMFEYLLQMVAEEEERELNGE